ncbi:transporter [Gluconacetobacter sacchari DSM 12717]|uniref:Lysylphosphatidylglycerol synthetase family protein n=2 Tax=Gluconacetobacter sacchari TaxID=92759 RepID=A0A7W4IEV2_9PROT|nr:lysylphosphatidylglycerol synthase domain-containing protein [Gluconacetobacter sacchari]MBB2161482.1 lysylphosphatidylglycerol synthetase family protein [Gluconacetobacter sacchari]GBQ30793.1 transporter [Gluconacetobacter sacchari DSM 12717]
MVLNCSPSPEGSQQAAPRWRRLLRHLPHLVGLCLMIGAIVVVQHEVRDLHWDDIRAALGTIPAATLVMGIGCTVLSYFILSFYDCLAVVQVGRRLSYRRAAFASFCSYVLSHNLGFAAISGAAVRFRLYGNWGLGPFDIAQIIAFCSATYLLGAGALIGAVLVLEPSAVPVVGARLPHLVLSGIGLLLWAAVGVYILLGLWLTQIRVCRWTVVLPRPGMAFAQMLVAAAEVAATAGIAYIFLPSGIGLGYGVFLAIYIASYTAGLVASVPGGLGVFDGAMMLALGAYLPPSQIVSTILVFRLFYYIIPLFMAGLMFAGHELFLRGDAALARKAAPQAPRRGPREVRPSHVIRESEADFSVVVATGAVSICGALLIALTILDPASWSNAGGLHHLVGVAGDYLLSLIGVVLIGLAVGLSQRVTLAWKLTLGLLVGAAALTMLRGASLAVPGILGLVAVLIAPFRGSYYRHARILSEPLAFRTGLSLLLLIGCVLVLACSGPRDEVGGSWWEVMLFTASHGVGQWTMGLAVVLGAVMIGRLVRPGGVAVRPWDSAGAAEYRALDHAMDDLGPVVPAGMIPGESGLALLPFLRTETFLIGLGDPAGSWDDCASAIWWLRDLAVQEHRQPAFWRVGASMLDVYNDLGLTSWPLTEADGEELYLCCLPQSVPHVAAIMESAGPVPGNRPDGA